MNAQDTEINRLRAENKALKHQSLERLALTRKQWNALAAYAFKDADAAFSTLNAALNKPTSDKQRLNAARSYVLDRVVSRLKEILEAQ